MAESKWLSGGQLITLKDYKLRIMGEIEAEMKAVFQQRYGISMTETAFDLLPTMDKEWIIHTASVSVQNRRKGKRQ